MTLLKYNHKNIAYGLIYMISIYSILRTIIIKY